MPCSVYESGWGRSNPTWMVQKDKLPPAKSDRDEGEWWALYDPGVKTRVMPAEELAGPGGVFCRIRVLQQASSNATYRYRSSEHAH